MLTTLPSRVTGSEVEAELDLIRAEDLKAANRRPQARSALANLMRGLRG